MSMGPLFKVKGLSLAVFAFTLIMVGGPTLLAKTDNLQAIERRLQMLKRQRERVQLLLTAQIKAAKIYKQYPQGQLFKQAYERAQIQHGEYQRLNKEIQETEGLLTMEKAFTSVKIPQTDPMQSLRPCDGLSKVHTPPLTPTQAHSKAKQYYDEAFEAYKTYNLAKKITPPPGKEIHFSTQDVKHAIEGLQALQSMHQVLNSAAIPNFQKQMQAKVQQLESGLLSALIKHFNLINKTPSPMDALPVSVTVLKGTLAEMKKQQELLVEREDVRKVGRETLRFPKLPSQLEQDPHYKTASTYQALINWLNGGGGGGGGGKTKSSSRQSEAQRVAVPVLAH